MPHPIILALSHVWKLAFFKQLTTSETHLIVILELGLLQPRAEVGQPPVRQAARGARGRGGGGAAGLGLGGHVAHSLDTWWTGGPVLCMYSSIWY